jgi:TRAP-type C4-dicarboxylate transport system permease small subunit
MTLKNPFKVIDAIEESVMVLSLGYMCCVIFLQVIMRYIFKHALIWPEETARFVQIWMIYIAVAACVRKTRHIRIDLFKDLLPPIMKSYVEIFARCFTLAFLGVIFYLGVLLVLKFIENGQTSPAVSIPMYSVAICIPLGVGLSIVRYLKELRRSNMR